MCRPPIKENLENLENLAHSCFKKTEF